VKEALRSAQKGSNSIPKRKKKQLKEKKKRNERGNGD
jgi:hypothetical protein